MTPINKNLNKIKCVHSLETYISIGLEDEMKFRNGVHFEISGSCINLLINKKYYKKFTIAENRLDIEEARQEESRIIKINKKQDLQLSFFNGVDPISRFKNINNLLFFIFFQ